MSLPKGGAKVLFLTGAPSIDEVASNQLLDSFVPEFRRFVGNEIPKLDIVPTPSSTWPNWRRLAVEGEYKQAKDVSTDWDVDLGATSVIPTPRPDLAAFDYDFLRHSLAAFEDKHQDGFDVTEVSFDDESTFLDDTILTDLGNDFFQVPAQLRTDKAAEQITNLGNLPHAAVVDKSYPQTITVNILVSIISVMPARSVEVRKYVRAMQLVEVIVGDETKSNFSVSFWVHASDSIADTEVNQTLRTALERLRPKQIVLMANVALRVWRGQVYGQSLRMGKVPRATTTIVQLDTRPSDSLPASWSKKRDAVAQWVSAFHVGGKMKDDASRRRSLLRTPARGEPLNSPLPPDSIM